MVNNQDGKNQAPVPDDSLTAYLFAQEKLDRIQERNTWFTDRNIERGEIYVERKHEKNAYSK